MVRFLHVYYNYVQKDIRVQTEKYVLMETKRKTAL